MAFLQFCVFVVFSDKNEFIVVPITALIMKACISRCCPSISCVGIKWCARPAAGKLCKVCKIKYPISSKYLMVLFLTQYSRHMYFVCITEFQAYRFIITYMHYSSIVSDVSPIKWLTARVRFPFIVEHSFSRKENYKCTKVTSHWPIPHLTIDQKIYSEVTISMRQ